MTIDALKELNQQLLMIKDRVRGVALGHANGMYLHGRPGTSKSYTVETTLEGLKVPMIIHKGNITPVGLFHLIRDNPQSIIVLDDVANILTDPVARQILLAALGTPPDGSRIRLVPYRTAHVNEVARFSGGIIVITNLPLASHKSEVLNAVRDRVHVIGYEPSDEMIKALILDLAKSSPRGCSADEAVTVAEFLLAECDRNGVRPSVRLFMDKAVSDYLQWKAGDAETHWRDLVSSLVLEEAITPTHPVQDVSRKERRDSHRRLVLRLCEEFSSPAERVRAWTEETGRGKTAFYNKYNELKKDGLLKVDAISDEEEVTPSSRSNKRKTTGDAGTMGLILG